MSNFMDEQADDRISRLSSATDSTHYSKHLLVTAVFEVKFLPLLELEAKIADIQKAELADYPKYQKIQERGVEVNLQQGLARTIEGHVVHQFSSDEQSTRSLSLAIDRVSLTLAHKSFKTIDSIKTPFMKAWQAVNKFAEIQPRMVRRIGLRYVNQFRAADLKERSATCEPTEVFWPKFYNRNWLPTNIDQQFWTSEDRLFDAEAKIGFTIRTAFNAREDNLTVLDIDSYRVFSEEESFSQPVEEVLVELHKRNKLWFAHTLSDSFLECLK